MSILLFGCSLVKDISLRLQDVGRFVYVTVVLIVDLKALCHFFLVLVRENIEEQAFEVTQVSLHSVNVIMYFIFLLI